jgi:hypothetical protein
VNTTTITRRFLSLRRGWKVGSRTPGVSQQSRSNAEPRLQTARSLMAISIGQRAARAGLARDPNNLGSGSRQPLRAHLDGGYYQARAAY